MDVTAIYIANTSAADLVQDQVAAAKTDLRYRQRLPFEVQLNMDGPLLRPLLTFEIKLPKESSVRVDSEISGQVEMLNKFSFLNRDKSYLSRLSNYVNKNLAQTYSQIFIQLEEYRKFKMHLICSKFNSLQYRMQQLASVFLI